MTQLDPVLVVIPAFNEEASVGAVVGAVLGQGVDALVVDDGSTDATAERARHAGAAVVCLPVNLGVGGALRCGFRFAVSHGYAVAVQVDADGQHDAAAIPVLLERMRSTQADMVVGSRFGAQAPGYAVRGGRRLAMRLLARTRVAQRRGGRSPMRRPACARSAARCSRTSRATIRSSTSATPSRRWSIAGRRGARIVECPIAMSPRAAGRPSAGVLASGWYVTRVLLAIELMRRRRARPPSPVPSSEGEP